MKDRHNGWMASASSFAAVVYCVAGISLTALGDAMTTPRLRDVRLNGRPAEKMHAFFRERMLSEFAQREIFGEARRAFEVRDDDVRGHGGLWRGEFWGKLMLGTARAADYLQDPALLAFVREECHRLMKLQDADGYLGSYADRELVSITDPEKTRQTYGWYPCWNLWNRKYAIWGFLMAYRATGDREILASAERQMDQWIAMLHRRGLRLHDTGTRGMFGLPSMSVLKPLLQLHTATGKQAYLDYAKEMLPDWDREDGMCPNFYRNAPTGKPLATWYPNPHDWAKCYEMMSCLDGLLEMHRVTGDARSLDTVRMIADNLEQSETNPFGGVGFGDKFLGAANQVNALSEVCDAIHWIRLNVDLFLITGEDRYMDRVERAYLNNFLPGVFRKGDYGAFFIRGNGRHENQFQCGFAYNHCCVNNMPRTWMDIAESAVTRDREGAYHVNLYQDAVVTIDGKRIEISGNYPIGSIVTVRAPAGVKLKFRKPGWCTKMDIANPAAGETTITFDMTPRWVETKAVGEDEDEAKRRWMFRRYADGHEQNVGRDVASLYRKTAAATLWRGPLLLAKAKRVGDSEEQIFAAETVNGKKRVPKLTALPAKDAAEMGVWGAWELEVTGRDPNAAPTKVRVCDFMSAGDYPLSAGANAFSIWF